MSLTATRLRLTTKVALAFSALSSGAWAAQGDRFGLNMTPGVTATSRDIYDLHMLIFWVCVVIGIAVFGVMFYSIIVHRKSRGAKAAQFHESTKLEIIWTLVPFAILIAMAVPASQTLIRQYDSSESEMDIIVTGYQWKWKYEYVGEDVSFFSNLRTSRDEINNIEDKGEHYLLEVDKPLVIPTDKKVRFLITANDVIHAWWVPSFAVKQDAIPGFINTAWTVVDEEGVYRGQCAELCGRDHGFMPIVVEAKSPADYDAWLGEQKQEAAALAKLMEQEMSMDQLMEEGKAVYERSCVACHGANGEGGVGTKMVGSAITTGPIDQHMDVIINGVSGTAMQAFGGQLNKLELAAVVTYERNAWGNNMGDKAQAVDVHNYMQGN
ncbi:MAG: cytochrome c oxidase subunit II [Pseudomonadales bacterium]